LNTQITREGIFCSQVPCPRHLFKTYSVLIIFSFSISNMYWVVKMDASYINVQFGS